jgi:hypothetical protein
MASLRSHARGRVPSLTCLVGIGSNLPLFEGRSVFPTPRDSGAHRISPDAVRGRVIMRDGELVSGPGWGKPAVPAMAA